MRIRGYLRPAGLAATLLLASLVCGCAGRYQRPDVAAPPAFRGDSLTSAAVSAEPGSPASFGELRWGDLIRDEELSKLIREALDRNFDVRIAAARVLEAQAQFRLARSSRFPSGDAGLTYNRFRGDGFFVPSVDLSPSTSWEADLWGRIRNASAAARAAVLAAEEARRGVLQRLVSDVACSYFLLRDLDLEIEITRQALELREGSLSLVRLRVDNGYSSELELREAEVLVKAARTALTGLELDREQGENQLALLLGRNPGPIPRGRSLLERQLAPTLPPGLPSALLDRRPDIRQAELQLIGDHKMVAVAKAAFFPTIALTASAGFASPALIGLFAPVNRTWFFGSSGLQPLFRGGALMAGLRGAQARRQQSLLAYQQTVQEAFREVADALAGYRKLAELRTQQGELVESLRQGVELADLAYKGGVASYLEFLDSERQWLDARLQLAQIRRRELTNVVTLYRALGGGWQ
jgi:outer membrane protein, multidrug efflux system